MENFTLVQRLFRLIDSRIWSFFVFLTIVLPFQIGATTPPTKDSTQVRYVKFTTSVDANYTRIELQEIKVFSGSENIALGKNIGASNNSYDYNIRNVIDGDPMTNWNSDDYITLTNDNGVGPTATYPHFIVVDLGSKYNLESLKLILASFDYTFDFKVSEDSINWALVDSKSNTRGEYTYTTIPIQNIRYIKYACYSSTDYGQVNVQEIQAFVGGVNVALNKKTKANSYEGNDPRRGADAVDGSSGSRWSSNRYDHVNGNRADSAKVEVTVDLGSVESVDSLALTFQSSRIFSISTSSNGVDWIEIDKRLNDHNEYLYKFKKPFTIISSVNSFTNNSAKCSAEIVADGGYQITSRGFCWGTSTQPTVLDNKTQNGSGVGSYLATLTGLQDNTVYYVRPYGVSADTVFYGKEEVFHFPLKIQTDVISNLTIYSATSCGYISNVGSIEVLEKGVCWSTNPFPTTTDNSSPEGTGSGEFTSNIYLNDASKYYVRAYAVTSMGVFYGNVVSFKYQPAKYLASDGFWSGEVFTETSPDFFQSPSGSYLSYNGYEWSISDWVTSGDAGNPPLTGWWDGTVFTPIPYTHAAVSYNKSSLTESTFNDGSFSETVAIEHDHTNGASFTGANQEDFIATGKAVVRNLPTGVTAKIIRNSNLSLTLKLFGNASNHAVADSLNNVKVMLYPAAFTDGERLMTSGNLKYLTLKYIGPTNISITDTKTSTDYTLTPEHYVTVENGGNFTVLTTTELQQLVASPGATFAVQGLFSVNDLVLKSNNDQSFNAKFDLGMTVKDHIYFQKELSDNRVYFLSFPCNVAFDSITMLSGGLANEDWYIVAYNGDKRAKWGSAVQWDTITSGNLVANKGYVVSLRKGIGTQTLQFVLQNQLAIREAEKSVFADYYEGNMGTHHKGWNLIGQPYLRTFAGGNIGVRYLTRWNGDRFIGLLNNQVTSVDPFEAFFVQVATSGSILFSNPIRMDAPRRMTTVADETLQLNVSSTTGSDFTNLLMNDSYSTAYTIGQDLEKIVTTTSEVPQIYSVKGEANCAYNALPVGDVIDLPIGVYSKSGGSCTISASNVSISNLSHVLLTDQQTTTTTDLTTGSYTFNAATGFNSGRFTLTIERLATSVGSAANGKEAFVYKVNGVLYIKQIPNGSEVMVSDALGRVAYYSKDVSESNIALPMLGNSICIVKIVTENRVKYWKVN